MKSEAMKKLVRAAVLAAVSGPARRDAYTRTAGISHDALADMRAALDELGIDWRAVRASTGRPPVKEVRK